MSHTTKKIINNKLVQNAIIDDAHIYEYDCPSKKMARRLVKSLARKTPHGSFALSSDPCPCCGIISVLFVEVENRCSSCDPYFESHCMEILGIYSNLKSSQNTTSMSENDLPLAA